uniref:mRNA cap guanine-N(7) methyltransferase n=1 Tax=Bionectria ochroleuca TaxID=29856 RepID=A0A8H7NF55_BIOOC
MNRRGFDVVSMMFSMHYAFESETNARNMLRNVAGALKKGGRFIGCIPNSDVLGEHVRKWNEEHAAKEKAAEEAKNDGSDADPEPAEEKEEGEADDDEPPADPGAEWGNSIYRVRFPGRPRGWRIPPGLWLEVQLLPGRGRRGGPGVRRALGGLPCAGGRFQPRAAVPPPLPRHLGGGEGRP